MWDLSGLLDGIPFREFYLKPLVLRWTRISTRTEAWHGYMFKWISATQDLEIVSSKVRS